MMVGVVQEVCVGKGKQVCERKHTPACETQLLAHTLTDTHVLIHSHIHTYIHPHPPTPTHTHLCVSQKQVLWFDPPRYSVNPSSNHCPTQHMRHCRWGEHHRKVCALYCVLRCSVLCCSVWRIFWCIFLYIVWCIVVFSVLCSVWCMQLYNTLMLTTNGCCARWQEGVSGCVGVCGVTW